MEAVLEGYRLASSLKLPLVFREDALSHLISKLKTIVRYQHTIVYWIKGIRLPKDEDNRDVVISAQEKFRAILTNNPDSYCLENDRKDAVANLILNKVYGRVDLETFNKYLADVSGQITELRRKEFLGGPYFVLVKEGTADKILQSHEQELEDFVVCFDQIDEEDVREYQLEEGIRTESKPYILNALSAVVLTTRGVIEGLKKASDSVVFFREDGKPVYSYVFWTSVNAFLCIGIGTEDINSIAELYENLDADRKLERVSQLLISSLETEDDILRSFLFAWTALEILINKTFTVYENQFIQELSGGDYPKARSQYLDRIRTVMKDKYRLTDKFALITSLLCPKDADRDIFSFEEAKKTRDKLSHGQDFDEAGLPVYSIQYLVQKYLRLHITAT